ncbi:response regulator transcription factor [Cohnella abietis]|uniref:DNA-binding response regulator n=1 Tax=Cohnella abietis TaxID=2507935 RepID=A0A3T1D1M4_9BACL|nr:response regulator [Cohnella abietis]BBI31919.1 hypothetical protein KCTCHS21_13180 [Cohnella abietis]
MYRVLIVDDESWIIESLKSSLKWEEHGFVIIGQAGNGIEAYEMIERLEPDVVFTDIRMPGMNGIELIKKGKALSLKTQFIVISGFADFDYAQKAMNNGAIGYCLKPFKQTELLELLNKAKQNRGKSAHFEFTDMLDLLDNRTPEGYAYLEQTLEQYGLISQNALDSDGNITASQYYFLVSIGSGTITFAADIPNIPFKLGRFKKAYLISNAAIDLLKENLLPQIGEDITFIGIGNRATQLEEIKDSLEAANLAAQQYFITAIKEVYIYRLANDIAFDEQIQRIGTGLRDADLEEVSRGIDTIAALFDQGIGNIKSAFRVYNRLQSFSSRTSLEGEESFLYSCEQLFTLFEDVRKMMSYLKDNMISSIIAKPSADYHHSKNESMQEILHYINRNYHEGGISIQSLSERFFMNPTYISQLFRKEVGETFTEYISRLRINHASELLRTTDLPVNEISERVGFQDYFYFSRIFKKLTGQTSSQYRDSNQT